MFSAFPGKGSCRTKIASRHRARKPDPASKNRPNSLVYRGFSGCAAAGNVPENGEKGDDKARGRRPEWQHDRHHPGGERLTLQEDAQHAAQGVLRKEKKLHHADMRLLEQRFKYACACLERHAYRQLAERHCERMLSIAAFRAEKQRIDAVLAEEYARLDAFHAAIRRANEPRISHTDNEAGLEAVLAYSFLDPAGATLPLLETHEFAALGVTKGCLTAEERKQIEAHVADSYSFLILIPWTQDLAGVPAIAHGHHEKLDGSGYPMGLKAGQISVQTRILTICDIFDALTAGDRPYKKALPLEAALDLLDDECRAGRLDGRLFEVFVEAQAWATAH